MTNLFTKAVRGNFAPADVTEPPEPFVSEADARGLKPPPLSDLQRAGMGVEAALAGRYIDSLASVERYQDEKLKYEKARDDYIIASVNARSAHAI